MVDSIGDGKEQSALDILHEQFDLSVAPCDALDLQDPDKYIVLKNGATELAPLLGELPNMGTALANMKALGQPAYAITFNGQSVLPGQLFQKNNGAYVSNLKSPSGVGFGKQADITPLDLSKAKAMNIANAAFGVASLVTATYYLKGIENKLGAIQDGVKEIQDFLETDKQSRILGDFDTLQRIAKEMDVIKQNEKRWSAEQHTVSRIMNDLAQDIRFYDRRVSDELKKYNTCKNKKARLASARKLNQAYESYQCCLQVYSAARLVDTQLAEQFDLPYLAMVKEDLLGRASDFDETYEQVIQEMWNGRLESKDAGRVRKQASFVDKAGHLAKQGLLKKSGLDKQLFEKKEELYLSFEEEVQLDISIAVGQKDLDVIGIDDFDELEQPKIMKPFIDTISSMEATYDSPMRMIVSGENVYLQIHTDEDAAKDDQPS